MLKDTAVQSSAADTFQESQGYIQTRRDDSLCRRTILWQDHLQIRPQKVARLEDHVAHEVMKRKEKGVTNGLRRQFSSHRNGYDDTKVEQSNMRLTSYLKLSCQLIRENTTDSTLFDVIAECNPNATPKDNPLERQQKLEANCWNRATFDSFRDLL